MHDMIHFVSAHSLLFLALFVVLVALIKIEWDDEAVGSFGTNAVSAQQAVVLMNHEQATLIDMRAQEEYARDHVVGAISVPFHSLDNQLNRLKQYSNHPLVIYGIHRKAFEVAKTTLAAKKIENVFYLTGGLPHWKASGMPTEETKGEENG